jgi:hypothetical protein
MMITLAFVLVDDGCVRGEGDLVCAYGEGVEDLVEVLPSKESI